MPELPDPMTAQLDATARGLRLFVMDVDGVLTDGGLYIGDEGQQFIRPCLIDSPNKTGIFQVGFKFSRIANTAFYGRWRAPVLF